MWSLCRFSPDTLPQYKDMTDVNMSVNGCLVVQIVLHLAPNVSWDWLQHLGWTFLYADV